MKNVTEWSVEFDLLYDNIESNSAPGLNEYEKSYFLTRAQENVVIQLYNGSAREPFEGSEELTKYLSSIVKQADGVLDEGTGRIHIVPENSYVFSLPDDILFRTFESCVLRDGDTDIRNVSVVPVTQDDLWRIRRDPFKCENRSRVLRLTYSVSSETQGPALSETEYSELISAYPVQSYTVRYLGRPSPIILTDLTQTGLSINGEKTPMTCLLPEAVHHTVLTEAVRLAKSVWALNNQN